MHAVIAEVIGRLRELGAMVPSIASVYPLSQPTFGEGAGESRVASFENGLGLGRLPEDLRVFYADFAPVRAMDVFNGYDIYDLRLTQHVFVDESLPSHFVAESEKIPVLPVAGDGGGNQFMIALSGGSRGRVWKWSHEAVVGVDRILILPQTPWGVCKVGDSYTDFLKRVAADWKAFVEGDQTWQYIAG